MNYDDLAAKHSALQFEFNIAQLELTAARAEIETMKKSGCVGHPLMDLSLLAESVFKEELLAARAEIERLKKVKKC